ncbi:hypothetical protein BI004_gp009 [Bacillus phage NotTheCreek]|uniref:hypothetical protein n=1 Tax=Bacillus phage NotTheCreek TaxID=1805952 RepID=UPI0007A76F64|nr:hypothetical protein BI004_gp009 [Bacillus phage NotTheCreek]AMW63230.1 hypothetical protein NOTTHECREEK_9 [Bacillus phage NotTheCreek]QDH49995.1 hypothetical protein ALPS_8 [Bacillus phage ALPS]
MTRHTRNRQLDKLGIKGYVLNVPVHVMTEHHQSEHRLDRSFKWNRYSMRILSAAYWKGKRFNKKTGKANWKVRATKVTNYVSYRANDNNLFGFTHVV